MSYSVHVTPQADHIRADISGVLSGESLSVDNWGPLIELCQERGVFRILMDVRELDVAIDTVRLYETGADLRRLRDAGIRVAFLTTPEKISPDLFYETVARNRGVSARTFTNEETAANWLFR